MRRDGKEREDAGISRRCFLGGAGRSALAFTAVPRFVLGGAGYAPPSDTLHVAVIGTGGRGKNDIRALFGHTDVQVVAIADPNEQSDYSAFYYKGVSGRKPVLKMVRDHYARQKGAGRYPGCAEYIDYREMLEREKHIDAVIVATPDHVHAVATMAAITRGKHVYCEKPLTHTVYEARKIAEAAREAGVATQMGNQGHSGEGIRAACEWIWDGAIGKVRDVFVWSDTGRWTRTEERPKDTPPCPSGLDWDLWIGPAPYRPYHPAYAPYNWRGWWDFGTGAVGDMGCHNIDAAFWALKLGAPRTVEASSTGVNPETTPYGSVIRYTFPGRGDMPPVRLTWYDGGLRPPRPPELEREKKLGGNGLIMVGDEGTMLLDGWSRNPRLVPGSEMKAYRKPPKTIPRSRGHMRDWIDASKGGRPASSNFDVSGPLAELVLLGNVALRTGELLYWDATHLMATNCPEADRYIRTPYRKGWSL